MKQSGALISKLAIRCGITAAIIGGAVGATVAVGPGGNAYAQQTKQAAPAAAEPAPMPEAVEVKQMALTEKQVQGLLAAQQDMDAITSKLPDDKPPDAKVVAQLDTVAKKYGFVSYADYGNVAGNVDLLLDGFDPQTKKFVGFEAVLKSQITQIQADTKIPPNDKKEALAELSGQLSKLPKVEFPANIDLVAKHYDKLNDALRGQE